MLLFVGFSWFFEIMCDTIGLRPVCRVRTSSGTFLSRGRDKVIRNIERKIANFTFLPVGKLLILYHLYLLSVTIYNFVASMMLSTIQKLFY